jgi:alkylresorcinol/alkylpyrone synthase
MTHPRVVSLGIATPPFAVEQWQARKLAERLFGPELGGDARLLQVFDHAQIDRRFSCVPLEWYERDHDFAEKNSRYVESAVKLAGEASLLALRRAGLTPEDVDHVVFVSSTGLATPSIDAYLANALGLRSDVRRTPVWGLGCAGGAAGMSLGRQLALAEPSARVLVIAIELCSLAFQPNDQTRRNFVATSLFGDGAAAALIVGPERGHDRNGHPPLELIASKSTIWKDTLDVMGWTVDGDGLHVVFSRDIPAIVREHVRHGLVEFLATAGKTLDDLAFLAVHPGGSKVLGAYADALDMPHSRFERSRETLRDFGNMSSPTCLFVLDRILQANDVSQGTFGLIAALGPGFSAEYVLVRAAS